MTKLLVDAGQCFSEYQDKTLRKLQCRRLQLDEIWAFTYCKAVNKGTAKAAPEVAGDIWTYVAMDSDTKLVASWLVGPRDFYSARIFVEDLEGRLANRVQITTDGYRPYLTAVPESFRGQVDYGMLVKHYATPSAETEAARRYSPTKCIGAERQVVTGNPHESKISTSHIERQNLTMRMQMRRCTRPTNAFSKKAENHAHAVALHFMHYNFCRIHKTLRITPAMAACVTDKLWEITDMVRMLEGVGRA